MVFRKEKGHADSRMRVTHHMGSKVEILCDECGAQYEVDTAFAGSGYYVCQGAGKYRYLHKAVPRVGEGPDPTPDPVEAGGRSWARDAVKWHEKNDPPKPLYPMDDSLPAFAGMKAEDFDKPTGITITLPAINMDQLLVDTRALLRDFMEMELARHRFEVARIQRWLDTHPMGGDDNAG